MTDYRTNFPKQMVIEYELNAKRLNRGVTAIKTFAILAMLLGPALLITGYLATPEGKSFFEPPYKSFAIGLTGTAVFTLLAGLYIFRKIGVTKNKLSGNHHLFDLSHRGIHIPQETGGVFLISWNTLKKVRSFRPTTFTAYGVTNVQMQFTHSLNGKSQTIGVDILPLKQAQIKSIKRYIVAFAPDECKVDYRNVAHWRKKFGYVS